MFVFIHVEELQEKNFPISWDPQRHVKFGKHVNGTDIRISYLFM